MVNYSWSDFGLRNFHTYRKFPSKLCFLDFLLRCQWYIFIAHIYVSDEYPFPPRLATFKPLILGFENGEKVPKKDIFASGRHLGRGESGVLLAINTPMYVVYYDTILWYPRVAMLPAEAMKSCIFGTHLGYRILAFPWFFRMVWLFFIDTTCNSLTLHA